MQLTQWVSRRCVSCVRSVAYVAWDGNHAVARPSWHRALCYAAVVKKTRSNQLICIVVCLAWTVDPKRKPTCATKLRMRQIETVQLWVNAGLAAPSAHRSHKTNYATVRRMAIEVPSHMKAPSSLAKLEKMRRLKNKNWRKH